MSKIAVHGLYLDFKNKNKKNQVASPAKGRAKIKMKANFKKGKLHRPHP